MNSTVNEIAPFAGAAILPAIVTKTAVEKYCDEGILVGDLTGNYFQELILQNKKRGFFDTLSRGFVRYTAQALGLGRFLELANTNRINAEGMLLVSEGDYDDDRRMSEFAAFAISRSDEVFNNKEKGQFIARTLLFTTAAAAGAVGVASLLGISPIICGACAAIGVASTSWSMLNSIRSIAEPRNRDIAHLREKGMRLYRKNEDEIACYLERVSPTSKRSKSIEN
jgi:hypothetical protein